MLAVMLRSDGTWKWNCCDSTASGTRTWKWGVSCSAEPKRWTKATAPVSGRDTPSRLAVRRWTAKLAWALVHILSLAQPGLNLSVFFQWIWTLVSGQRGDRLIVQRRDAIAPTIVEAQRPASDVRAAK